MAFESSSADRSEYLVDIAGELHGVIVKGVSEYLRADDVGKNKIKTDALNGLASAGLITETEKQRLASLTDTVIKKDRPAAESLKAVTTFSTSENLTSPVAKVMVKIAEDSLRTPGITFGAVAHADVDGALVGGILGFELTKGAGTVAGMIIGAAAASVAQAL